MFGYASADELVVDSATRLRHYAAASYRKFGDIPSRFVLRAEVMQWDSNVQSNPNHNPLGRKLELEEAVDAEHRVLERRPSMATSCLLELRG